MSDAIKNFAQQFAFEPQISNNSLAKRYDRYIFLGMGGSHLAADLALCWRPDLPLTIFSDYGLPSMSYGYGKKSLVIANSYSGNTEETITGLTEAVKKHLPIGVIAVGGKLIDLAKKKHLPYIQLPDTGIQPRSALGFSLRALFKIMNEEAGLRESKRLAKTLDPSSFALTGKALAQRLLGHIPVIYSSRANQAIAYNWKIKFNETGKIPAFYNVLPELNHNEMTGFDVKDSSKDLSDRFHFIFLKDAKDHPRVQKRLDILQKLYRDRGLAVDVLELQGETKLEKIFSSLLLADWAALHMAENYGLESEQVPMVEEFKKLMVD